MIIMIVVFAEKLAIAELSLLIMIVIVTVAQKCHSEF